MIDELFVGKKGEILPKKPLRDVSRIEPGDHILVEASPNKLIITKILTIDELLELPRIAKGTPKEIESELDEASSLQEAEVD
nr:hypothetical protein [Candidatus Sigynarchaeota archaeon]